MANVMCGFTSAKTRDVSGKLPVGNVTEVGLMLYEPEIYHDSKAKYDRKTIARDVATTRGVAAAEKLMVRRTQIYFSSRKATHVAENW